MIFMYVYVIFLTVYFHIRLNFKALTSKRVQLSWYILFSLFWCIPRIKLI